jgi:hypothetical protein
VIARTEIRVAAPDRELAARVAAWLKDNDAEQINIVNVKNIDAAILPSIVTAVMLGFAGLSTILVWLRRQTGCAMIVDARNGRLSITYDCRDRRGRTIIVCDENTKVEVLDPEYLLDLGELAKLAVTKGAEAVSAVARDASIEFSIERGGSEE